MSDMFFVLASQASAPVGSIIYIAATGGSIITTCDYFDMALRYHNGAGDFPVAGDYIYTDSAMTTPLNGNSLYYTDDFGTSYRISSVGYVMAAITGNCII